MSLLRLYYMVVSVLELDPRRVPGSPSLPLRQAPPTQCLLLQVLLLKDEPATPRRSQEFYLAKLEC